MLGPPSFSMCRPPPREQSKYERWSLVYFTRPGNSVVLRALGDKSPIIADAVAKADNPDALNPGVTSKEWFARRIKYQRINNRKVCRCCIPLQYLVERCQ